MGLFDFLKSKNKSIQEVQKETEENIVDKIIEEDTFLDAEAVSEKINDVLEEESALESSDIEETMNEKSTIEEPTIVEPMIEEPTIQEPEIEEPTIQEPFVEEATIVEPVVEIMQKEKKGIFARLKEGLNKTRDSILGSVDGILSAFTKIDEDLFEELEEILIMADMGVETTMNIIDNIRKRVKKEGTTDPAHIKGMIVDEISNLLLDGADEAYDIKTPAVVLIIGVNGVGKTTTIGKLANNLKSDRKSVLLGAADTFRAAAIDQLEVWGERSGIEVIKHEENSDPAAVVFDAVSAAKNRKTDVLICDTAGRLHNKKNLMEELKKITKVIEREYPSAHRETYLVLDATTGQNAMQQAKLFKEVADITGIVLTKLDGTAKGGIVVAIKNELKIPVRYIGVGEGIEDLQKFDARSFAKALFGEE